MRCRTRLHARGNEARVRRVDVVDIRNPRWRTWTSPSSRRAQLQLEIGAGVNDHGKVLQTQLSHHAESSGQPFDEVVEVRHCAGRCGRGLGMLSRRLRSDGWRIQGWRSPRGNLHQLRLMHQPADSCVVHGTPRGLEHGVCGLIGRHVAMEPLDLPFVCAQEIRIVPVAHDAIPPQQPIKGVEQIGEAFARLRETGPVRGEAELAEVEALAHRETPPLESVGSTVNAQFR